jgi:hypothetical protein
MTVSPALIYFHQFPKVTECSLFPCPCCFIETIHGHRLFSYTPGLKKTGKTANAELFGEVTPFRIGEGVYEIQWAVRPVRIVVLSRIPKAERNALWLLFSTVPENVKYGAEYSRRSDEMSTLLNDLFRKYEIEGFAMPYTIEDYRKDYVREHIDKLPPEERLRGLPRKNSSNDFRRKNASKVFPRKNASKDFPKKSCRNWRRPL